MRTFRARKVAICREGNRLGIVFLAGGLMPSATALWSSRNNIRRTVIMQTPALVLTNSLAPGAVENLVTYARMAEERGFRSVLVSEAGSDALAVAQHLASVTSRIQIGTCITNVYLRPPLLAALHAMTIDRFAPGRLLLGLGTSSEALNRLYGVEMTKPATVLREYVRAVTSALRGEHETLAQMKKMGMTIPQAAHQIPVYVGTASQKCLEVTGELADGCFTSQCAPHGLQEVKEHLSRGAQRTGRSQANLPLAPLVHCCVEADRGVALRADGPTQWHRHWD